MLASVAPGIASAEDVSSTTPTTATSAPALDPYNPADVEKLVRIYYADIPSMVAAAKCESMYRQFNASGGVLYGGWGGSMIGVFQISSIHVGEAAALGMDIKTLEGNLAYARHLYDASGMDPWMSSYNCWHGSSQTSSVAGQNTSAVAPSAVYNLSYGQTNSYVLSLQKMLNSSGYAVAPSGPGSPGMETTKFGDLTRAAVRRFQCAKSIVCSGSESTTGYGLVDQKTYDALSTLAASSSAQQASAPTSAPQTATPAATSQTASAAGSSDSATDKAAEIAAVKSQITTLVSQLDQLNLKLADLTK
jgi:peptidoglycan hydrolase-like protein with peptidoglycan-binding domain